MGSSRLFRCVSTALTVVVTWALMFGASQLFIYGFHREPLNGDMSMSAPTTTTAAAAAEKPPLAPSSSTSRVAESAPTARRRPPTEQQQKNVLFVVADDLRPQMGAYGHPETLTPHLNEFAKRSMVFDAAYCQVPSCNPSRNSFLTGRSPFQNRIFFFEGDYEESVGTAGADTFFHHFRRMGYKAYGVGKLFHDFVPQTAFSPENGAYFPDDYNQEWGQKKKQTSPEPGKNEEWTERDLRERDASYSGCDDVTVMKGGNWDNEACFRNGFVYVEDRHPLHFFDARVAELAVGTLKKHEAPFILGVGFHDPHFKWHMPLDLWSLYSNETKIKPPRQVVPVKGTPLHSVGDFNLGNVQMHDGREFVSPMKSSRQDMRREKLADEAAVEMRRAYSAAVSHVDRNFGRLLDALKEEGVEGSTLVVFTADHGMGLGEASHWGKGSVQEVDARVPLIVHDPSHPQSHGQRSSQLVELLDIYPSLVDLAGPKGQYKKELYAWSWGQSWRPILERRRQKTKKEFALTIITACYYPNEHAGRFAGGCCRGRSFSWAKHVDKQYGPKAPLVGFGVRTTRWRYVAWLLYDSKEDDVDWSSQPYSEELYNFGSPLDPTRPDFDAWTELGNLLYPTPHSGKHRDEANRHLQLLRRSLQQRNRDQGEWGRWKIVKDKQSMDSFPNFSIPFHHTDDW